MIDSLSSEMVGPKTAKLVSADINMFAEKSQIKFWLDSTATMTMNASAQLPVEDFDISTTVNLLIVCKQQQ